MSKTRAQQLTDKSIDLLTGSTFGAVVIYSIIACLQILNTSVAV